MLIWKENNVKVAGVSFGKRQAMLWNFKKQQDVDTNNVYLTLSREPNNVHDKNAIKVMMHSADGKYHAQVGYVPKEIARVLAKKMDNDKHKVICAKYKSQPYIHGSAYNYLGVTCDILAFDKQPN